jgi:hypothetical protein
LHHLDEIFFEKIEILEGGPVGITFHGGISLMKASKATGVVAVLG